MVYTIDHTFDTQSRDTEQRHADICYCPACLGLQCLERPRFFAGQLLTEAELNSEQAYVIAKNKLHNRYLHGWGVVCGLQVVCHPCDGWVTVKSGYALDPCGNDIIVCEEQNFDVIKSIKECIESRRRKRRQDCDPLRPTYDPKCDELEEHWCLTVAYEEKEARPITALRPEKSGGCGCNGNGKSKKCGCGAGGQQQGKSTGTCSTPKVKSGVGTTVGACEPTRIFEQFRLQLIERPDHCGQRKISLEERLVKQSRYKYFGYIKDENTRRALSRLMSAAPPDSAFMRIIDCVTGTIEFVDKRIPDEDRSLLKHLFISCLLRKRQKDLPVPPVVEDTSNRVEFNANDTATTTIGTAETVLDDTSDEDGVIVTTRFLEEDSDRIYRLCCRLQKIVYELYTDNPFNVRCTAECPPCGAQEYIPIPLPDPATGIREYPASEYNTVLDGICCSLDLLVQYVIDCFCQALLPPCPPDPQDDRLVLACLTVKKGKIIDICNFSCRHYAGSFPAVNYWLSLVPVIPLITNAFARFCCDFNLFDFVRGYIMPGSDESRPLTDSDKRRAASFAEGGESGDPFSTLMNFGSMFGEVLKKASFTGTTRSYRDLKQRTAQAKRAANTGDELEQLRAELAALRDEVQSLRQKE